MQLDGISESDLLEAITARVKNLVDESPDLLVSYLYRLDIEEDKINAVLKGLTHEDPIAGISNLILERQKQRIASKKNNKQKPIEGWEF